MIEFRLDKPLYKLEITCDPRDFSRLNKNYSRLNEFVESLMRKVNEMNYDKIY